MEKKKFSVSKIPGSLNLKFTFQFDHSSKWEISHAGKDKKGQCLFRNFYRDPSKLTEYLQEIKLCWVVIEKQKYK